MKTRHIASGIAATVGLIASLGITGCGAEVGDGAAGDSAEIGSTSQALDSVGATNDLKDAVEDLGGSTNITDPVAREWAASCEIQNGPNGNEAFVKLIVGGFNSSGNALSDAYMKASTGEWAKVASLPSIGLEAQARGFAKMIPVPGAPNKCMLAGGFTTKAGAAVLTHALVFTADGDEGSWADAGTITGRAFHDMIPCGSNRIAVIGGHSASGFGNPINGSSTGIQVWNGSTGGGAAAWANKADLSTPVSGFGLAQKSLTRWAIAGGVPSGASSTNVVKAYTFSNDTNCDVTALTTTATLKNVSDGSTAALGRVGLVAFFDVDSDDLKVVAGKEFTNPSGTDLPTDRQNFTVDWTNATVANRGVTYVNHTTNYVTGTRFPSLAFDTVNNFLYLAGGENNASATYTAAEPLNALQEIDLSSIAIDKSITLGTARLGAAATYVRTADSVYVSTGETDDSPFTLTTTAEIVDPR